MLGFSQGCATLCRRLVHAKPHHTRLILRSGELPADVLERIGDTLLSARELPVVCGTRDEPISEEAAEKHLQMSESTGLQPHALRFDGRHEMPAEIVSFIAE